MQEIFEFVGTVLQQAEFWAVSTTGFGLVSVVSLLWNNKTSLASLGQKVAIEGLKKALADEVANTTQITLMAKEQQLIIKEQKEAIETLNANIYILAQAANIGADNKQLIAKNFEALSKKVPVVSKVEQKIDNKVAELKTKVEQIEKSSLDELIKLAK